MRSCANGHSAGNGSGAHGLSNSGPGHPYMLTICGISLNPVPPRWQDMILDFGP